MTTQSAPLQACSAVVVSVHTEQPTGNGAQRFDLVIIANGHSLAADVQHPHVQSPSYVRDGSALHAGRVVQNAESVKMTTYAKDAADLGLTFFPLVIDTFGHWGNKAMEFANLIPKLLVNCERRTGYTPDQMRRRIVQAMSMAQLRRNHFVCVEGHTKSRQLSLIRNRRTRPSV